MANEADGLDKFIKAVGASAPNDVVEANKSDEPMAEETNVVDEENVTEAANTIEITVANGVNYSTIRQS